MNHSYAEIAELAFFIGSLTANPAKADEYIQQFNIMHNRIPGFTKENENRHIRALIRKMDEDVFDEMGLNLNRLKKILLEDKDEMLITCGKLLERSMYKENKHNEMNAPIPFQEGKYSGMKVPVISQDGKVVCFIEAK